MAGLAGLAGPLLLLRNEDHTIRDTFFDRFSKATPLSVDGFPEDDINQPRKRSTRTPVQLSPDRLRRSREQTLPAGWAPGLGLPGHRAGPAGHQVWGSQGAGLARPGWAPGLGLPGHRADPAGHQVWGFWAQDWPGSGSRASPKGTSGDLLSLHSKKRMNREKLRSQCRNDHSTPPGSILLTSSTLSGGDWMQEQACCPHSTSACPRGRTPRVPACDPEAPANL